MSELSTVRCREKGIDFRVCGQSLGALKFRVFRVQAGDVKDVAVVKHTEVVVNIIAAAIVVVVGVVASLRRCCSCYSVPVKGRLDDVRSYFSV